MFLSWLRIGHDENEPTPERRNRGTVTFKRGGTGVADVLRLQRKNSADTYERVDLATSDDIPSPVTVSDTGSVDLTLTGQDISADVLYAGSGVADTAAHSDHTHAQLHNPVTVLDTSSINLTLSGQQVSGAVLPAGVSHAGLANLTTGDPHTQYLLETGGTISGNLTVQGDTALGNGNNDLTTLTGRFKAQGGAFTVAPGTEAGTTATATPLRGCDTAGAFDVVTGGAGIGVGVIATVTFAQARPNTDYLVRVDAASINAADLNLIHQNRLTTGFDVRATVAPGSGETLTIQFFVTEVVDR